MQNMSQLHTKKPIFPHIVRQYYLICGTITWVGLLLFAAFMFCIAYTQDNSKIPCFFVAITFSGLGITYLAIWFSNIKLINASYEITEQIILNSVGRFSIAVSKDEITFQKAVAFDFSMGKGRISAKYIVLFSNSTSDDICESGRLYKRVRSIWEAGCVIIPANDSVS